MSKWTSDSKQRRSKRYIALHKQLWRETFGRRRWWLHD
jgi:hypothetical protein